MSNDAITRGNKIEAPTIFVVNYLMIQKSDFQKIEFRIIKADVRVYVHFSVTHNTQEVETH